MVDKNEVYLDIKLNYKNVIKEINSKDLLTIDEIKTKIKELFGLNRCNFEDLDLFIAKNNNKIISEEDLIFLSDEISEYQYVIEIKVENKNKSYATKDEIEKLKNEIKELERKKKELIIQKKIEKEKTKIIVEKNQKKMKTKKEIQSQKKIKYQNYLKNKLTEECWISVKNILDKKIKELLINDKNKEEIKDEINKLINGKKNLLNEEVKKLLENLSKSKEIINKID